MSAETLDIAHHQDVLALASGAERLVEARLLARALLERIEAADIDHETAAAAVRTILAALEGRP